MESCDWSRVWLLATSSKQKQQQTKETRASVPSGVLGLFNCLQREPGSEKLRCLVDLDGILSDSEIQQQMTSDVTVNVFKDGGWGHFVHLPLETDIQRPVHHAHVDVATRGDLSSLTWIESPLKLVDAKTLTQIAKNDEFCRVLYTSLNFRDVMLATGKLPPDAIPGNFKADACMLGMEFSGISHRGKRVMGIAAAEALATSIQVPNRFLWQVPDSWSLLDAATVPVVYSTAYYALVVRAKLQRNERVLVHSGSGGVGQAAIAIALHYGCEVYTSVGSKEKKEFLKRNFPTLSDKNFCDSRSCSFEHHVLRSTKGQGCDVILNSLAGDKLQASVRCLAKHGRFLEIGKFDLARNSELGMAVFLKNVTFHGILLDSLFENGSKDWWDVQQLVADGLRTGVVRPLNSTVFAREDVEAAFRFMAQGKHVGKVVVEIQNEASFDPCLSVLATPRTYCHPNKSYVITGGLGGVGMQLADWLINRGAKNIVLTSRSGVKTGYQQRCLNKWNSLPNVTVVVTSLNICDKLESEKLISLAESFGPVGGIFHLAMVLRDGLFSNRTQQDFEDVCKPKVTGTQNLDLASRQPRVSASLDWFVVFSSISCGRGNTGQSNYGLANSVMERICEQRRSAGLPALAVQWGAIGDVGVAMEIASRGLGGDVIEIGGTRTQSVASCFECLDKFLCQDSEAVVSSFVPALKRVGAEVSGSKSSDVRAAVAHVLGISDFSSVNCDASLGDLGLDSLMGVEVKQILENSFDRVFPMKDVRLMTFAGIAQLTNEKRAPSKTITNNESAKEQTGSVEKEQKPSEHEIQSLLSIKHDILMPCDVVVTLQTRKNAAMTSPMFIVHPIEGHTESLREMSSHLECDVFGLQFTRDAPTTSIQDLAAFYVEHILKTCVSETYVISGYSFGACVAIEVTCQLMARGKHVQHVVLLDGAHRFVSSRTQRYKNKMATGSEAEQQAEALVAFTNQFCSVKYSELITSLLSFPDLQSRVISCFDHVTRSKISIDRSDFEAAACAFYFKLVMADQYNVNNDVTSVRGIPVTLVRCEEGQRESALDESQDYGLSELFDQVSVDFVSGDHQTFIQGNSAKKVAEILTNRICSS